MTRVDKEVLELLDGSGLILTPKAISKNIDRDRDNVNRRLRILEEHDLVERPTRGWYRISDRGSEFLNGRVALEELIDEDDGDSFE